MGARFPSAVLGGWMFAYINFKFLFHWPYEVAVRCCTEVRVMPGGRITGELLSV